MQMVNESGTDFDKVQAETRLEKLEEVYREFEAIQRQLLEKIGELSEDDMAEEKSFEEKYFEVKALLKRFVKQTSMDGAASQNTDAIMQLLRQQTELMQHIRHA